MAPPGSFCQLVPTAKTSIESLGIAQANVLNEIGKSSEILPKAKGWL
jgi:hypothetical protein